MYVRPEARRLGAASLLLDAILAEASKRFEQIELDVAAGNSAALALYEKFGFVLGTTPRALKTASGYQDDILMVKFLDAAADVAALARARRASVLRSPPMGEYLLSSSRTFDSLPADLNGSCHGQRISHAGVPLGRIFRRHARLLVERRLSRIDRQAAFVRSGLRRTRCRLRRRPLGSGAGESHCRAARTWRRRPRSALGREGGAARRRSRARRPLRLPGRRRGKAAVRRGELRSRDLPDPVDPRARSRRRDRRDDPRRAPGRPRSRGRTQQSRRALTFDSLTFYDPVDEIIARARLQLICERGKAPSARAPIRSASSSPAFSRRAASPTSASI